MTVYEFTGSIYTDDDWHFDRNMFKGYISNYFENSLYEYTAEDDYIIKFRRIFDDYDAAVEFVQKFKESIGGRDKWRYEDIVSCIEDMIQDFWRHKYGECSYDGNSEVWLCIREITTTAKKVKKIIYEDETED